LVVVRRGGDGGADAGAGELVVRVEELALVLELKVAFARCLGLESKRGLEGRRRGGGGGGGRHWRELAVELAVAMTTIAGAAC